MLCLFLSERTWTSSRARDGTQWGKWHQFSPRSGLEGKMGLERQSGVTGGSWPQVWEYGFSSPSTTSWVSLLTVDWKSVFTTCKMRTLHCMSKASSYTKMPVWKYFLDPLFCDSALRMAPRGRQRIKVSRTKDWTSKVDSVRLSTLPLYAVTAYQDPLCTFISLYSLNAPPAALIADTGGEGGS